MGRNRGMETVINREERKKERGYKERERKREEREER